MTTTSLTKYKVASIQASSVFFDAAATTAKTISLLREAAAGGAKLVVLPELWRPGYIWMYPYPATTKFIPNYYANSVCHDGPEADQIRAVCKELKIMAIIGVSEKEHGSLYMVQWIIGEDGEFIARRRKIKPSIVERLVFGEGDGSDIKGHSTPLGRVGALMCWEHAQPLLKYTVACMHEELSYFFEQKATPELEAHCLSVAAKLEWIGRQRPNGSSIATVHAARVQNLINALRNEHANVAASVEAPAPFDNLDETIQEDWTLGIGWPDSFSSAALDFLDSTTYDPMLGFMWGDGSGMQSL